MPEWSLYTEAELIELIDCLLDAKRPRAAFYIAHLDWSKIGTLRLKRLLFEICTVDTELAAHYLPESFDISEALSALNARGGVDQDEMARLEFMYIEALEYSEHGMPNLERWISESPIGFVQILALVFKRNDGGQDPPEWHIVQAEKRTALASAADGLLARISRIPGIGDGGEIDVEVLAQWIAEARRLCTEHGRATIDDQYIGQILARAPADEDGLQPALSD